MDDEALILAARRGDERAFRGLLERYYDMVRSVAYSAVNDQVFAAEIAHEAFVIAWKRLPQFDAERASFSSWVCGIAKRTVLSKRKSTGSRLARASMSLSHGALDLKSDAPSPIQAVIAAEERDIVIKALEKIPEPYRSPLVLVYEDQMSMTEAAHALNINETALRKRLSRGRRLLQAKVDAYQTRPAGPRPRATFIAAVLAAIGAQRRAEAKVARHASPYLRAGGQGRRLFWTSLGTIGAMMAGLVYFAIHRRGDSGPPGEGEGMAKVTRPTAIWKTAPVKPAALVAPAEAETAASARPSPLPESPPPSVGKVLLRIDFEDLELPAGFEGQRIEGAPCSSGACAVAPVVQTATNATKPPKDRYETAILFAPQDVEYRSSATLKFDYLAPREINLIQFALWGASGGRHYQFYVKTHPGSWNHVEFRLSDLKPKKGAPPLRDGQPIARFGFYSGWADPFYVDNIEIVDEAAESP